MSVKTRMTAEELWELPETPGKRFELVKGELVEVPGAGLEHAELVRLLLRLLDPFVSGRGLGDVYGDGLAYTIARSPDVVRVPDVSFIARGRIPKDAGRGFVPFAPDLAVEIVSPSDRAEDVYGKVRGYLEAGVRMVWVVWPAYRAITVHTVSGEVRELSSEDTLDGGDVLPGFQIPVSELFSALR